MSMFDSTNVLTPTVLAAALSGYGIDFMSGYFVKNMDARASSSRTMAENLDVSFSKPIFDPATNQVIIDNIMVMGNVEFGTVYFVLVLYKQFVTDAVTNETSVKIRLNADPTPWQMLNCKNWQNNTAEACARAVYSGDLLSIQLNGVQNNSMYLLYYMIANEYPFRPVAAYTV